MKAIIVPSAGAPPEVRDDIAIPEPSEGEILVKTAYTAINPITPIPRFSFIPITTREEAANHLSSDALMATAGVLVTSWPFTPGCDVSGTVVKVGENAINALGQPFKEGDHVFGCTTLGVPGYAAWAEYLLMNASVTLPKPANMTFAQASASGVGILTACLGVVSGLKVPLPDPAGLAAPTPRDEWALVFGGAGSVGQFAVQLLKGAGFKVVTTCSAKSFESLRSLGADATISYTQPPSSIVAEIKTITSSCLSHAFDAVSLNNSLLSSLYSSLPTPPSGHPRLYTTTNDWDPVPRSTPKSPVESTPLELGPIGRPEAGELNAKVRAFIPVVYWMLESGRVRASEYTVEGEGIEGVLKAWDVQKSGVKGGTKIVVRVEGE
ncbi:Nn.00g027910.m01.CDS01 [Neocucurbitaria sp. VM-36]